MNIVVITARMDSERLPGKALTDLGGMPNLARLIERFRKCRALDQIIIATTERESDGVIARLGDEWDIPAFRGSCDDVLGRVLGAAKCWADSSEPVRILRATTDCPFISWNLVDLAFDLFKYYPGIDTARLWGLGERVPVYGAGEFPVSLACLERMNKGLGQGASGREHVTSDIDAERLHYRLVYPIPPRRYKETFYRPYRLELDTPEDLVLVNKIIAELGINPPLHQVIRFLDAHPELAAVNAGIMEKTGPAMYSFEQKARWKSQQSMNTVEWRGDWSWLNDDWTENLPPRAKPLYCDKGIDYLGYVLSRGELQVLHTKDGHEVTGLVKLTCDCGAGRTWREG